MSALNGGTGRYLEYEANKKPTETIIIDWKLRAKTDANHFGDSLYVCVCVPLCGSAFFSNKLFFIVGFGSFSTDNIVNFWCHSISNIVRLCGRWALAPAKTDVILTEKPQQLLATVYESDFYRNTN